MKLIAILAALGLALCGQAQSVTNVFLVTTNALISDANPTGYTSYNLVSGVVGNIEKVEVTLNFSGGYNGDLSVYLSYATGYAVLLNRIGKEAGQDYGSASVGLDITLSDTALTDIHLADDNGGNALTGLWQPDGRAVDPQNVLTSNGRTALLSSFNGLNPNGTWTLFVADWATGYQSTLVNWSMTIVTVPEPGSLQLLAACGGLAVTGLWWRRRQMKS